MLVTARVAPFQGREGEGHYVYLNGTAARATAATDVAGAAGDGGGRETIGGHWMTLAPSVTSPVGGALDAKGFLVDIEKI